MGSAIYGKSGLMTGEFNPLKQPQAVRELRERQDLEREQYQNLRTALFGSDDGGDALADVNGDGLSASDTARAYEIMGIEPNVFSPIRPTTEQLEKAVGFYRAEQDSN